MEIAAYVDGGAFEEERRALFAREWIAVGRVEDFTEPGAFVKVPLTPAGVLVARGDDAELRAFHAICTHRGSTLTDAEDGCAKRFTCPYHGMVFDLRGQARGGPPPLIGTAPLAPVRLAVAKNGFVFVSLDPDAPVLALDDAPPWLARPLPQLRRIKRTSYDIGANWKLVVENFQEALHFGKVHAALEALTPSARADTWTRPVAGSSWLGGVMGIREGVETVSRTGAREGRPFLVPEEERRHVRDAMRFPNLLTSLQPDYLLTFQLFPLAVGATRVVASTYVHESVTEGGEDILAFWAQVYEEDKLACERQQVGLSSLGARPPSYSDVEDGALAFTRLVAERLQPHAHAPGNAKRKHCGIFGKPYADLSSLVDTSMFPALDSEITQGLAVVEATYTGGSLKWMGVCAPWVMEDGYLDSMDVIRDLPRAELETLVSLGDDPGGVDLDDEEIAFGDETDHPLTLAQMKWLKMRHGVYFPWKVCYHLLENDRWDDKHSGEGKGFAEEARRVFPKTVAFIESLPFEEIGRVVLFGVEANDHAPAHRDSEPGKALTLAQSISFAPGPPARKKRFYLKTPDGSGEVVVDAPIYWFNDMDWHGVHADPYFRYSIRVDGVFEPSFLARIRAAQR